MKVHEMYDFLLDNDICNESFLNGAIMMGGFCEDTLKCVLYYHTGYRDFEQYIECELGEEE